MFNYTKKQTDTFVKKKEKHKENIKTLRTTFKQENRNTFFMFLFSFYVFA